MKILYAIQGTGNGHLARALEIVPLLKEMGETDILVSGVQADIQIPFEINHKFYGISFIFGKKGGVDLWRTLIKLKPLRFLRDIRSLSVDTYDIVFNDFEPVSAWACKFKRKKCIGLSHQNAVLHPRAPRPENRDWLGQFILKHYSPAQVKYGFHFRALDEKNFTPVIRKSIREANPENKLYYTVYLPAYSDAEIIKILGRFKEITWHVFSKNCKEAYSVNNIHFNPVSVEGFNQSFINCKGILCNAGFETPAEALFMGKKLCVVPMKNQYEQACNAALLADMGIAVSKKNVPLFQTLTEWLSSDKVVRVDFPNNIKNILHELVKQHNTETKSMRLVETEATKISSPSKQKMASHVINQKF